MKNTRWMVFGVAVISLILLSLGCSFPLEGLFEGEEEWSEEEGTGGEIPTLPPSEIQAKPTSAAPLDPTDKWSLWTHGTQLRGANIWSRVVIPDLDGEEFLGDEHVGPPYTQEDFNHLAELGANYINLSHPGLFTEKPPYILDEAVKAHLDRMLEMAANAGLFAVITFRTGPGRSDFTYYRDGAGDWFDEDLLIEWVWEEQDAQDAWVEMWRYTAQRYKDNPVVIGFELMCEPNSAGAFFEIYEPDEFYSQYAGTTYDWNQFYPRIVEAIREVDQETPILIGGMGWSAVRWLPYLEPVDAERIVYVAHQYEPQSEYTHQEANGRNAYPDELDLDWDGEKDSFDLGWLEEYLSTIAAFQSQYGAPVLVNEYGVNRWVEGGAEFMSDQMALFEAMGINYALWAWYPEWKPYFEDVNAMNFLLGPEPKNLDPILNELQDVIVSYWARNEVRP